MLFASAISNVEASVRFSTFPMARNRNSNGTLTAQLCLVLDAAIVIIVTLGHVRPGDTVGWVCQSLPPLTLGTIVLVIEVNRSADQIKACLRICVYPPRVHFYFCRVAV